jgi:histidyl-tRNA synthetase
MNTNIVKGFKDFLGEEARKRSKIKKILVETFELFGFEPAETPIVEAEEFVRGDNSTDEAVSDIFTLNDKAKRNLALKYENTFQLKRIAQNQRLPYKRYQIERVFRNEPVKKGRQREFTQCDVDTIGSSLQDEAEMIFMLSKVLEKLKIKFKIKINNRQLINEVLETEDVKEKDREQVIRELDKLDKLSRKEVADNLKKLNAEKILILLENEKNLEKYEYYNNIKKLQSLLGEYKIKTEFTPTLARGLSYYNGTVLEVVGIKGDLGTIAAGGAYLINQIQSFGFAFGLDRIALLSEIEPEYTEYLLVSLDQDKKTINLANSLREKGSSVQVLMDKSLKKAMEYANTKNIKKVIVIGETEVKDKKYKVKDMESGRQEILTEKQLL